MIEITVGQHDAGDRRMPALARMQFLEALNLGAHFRRRIQEKPAVVVGADRDRLLCARAKTRCSSARLLTVIAAAVPLGEPTTSCRTKNANAHGILLRARTLDLPSSLEAHGRSYPSQCNPQWAAFAALFTTWLSAKSGM